VPERQLCSGGIPVYPDERQPLMNGHDFISPLSSVFHVMKDIQNLSDDRRINIRKVGVRRISYPVTVLDKARSIQKTVATVNMYVNLPHRFKGTHMSRFIEILNRFHGEINLKSFHRILQEMKDRLNAEAAHMEIEFPYFLQRGQSPRFHRHGAHRMQDARHPSENRRSGDGDHHACFFTVRGSAPRDCCPAPWGGGERSELPFGSTILSG
jgi:hypothetical protein